MATTDIHPIESARAHQAYVHVGRGMMGRVHRRTGTTRAAYEIGDMSPREFVEMAEACRRQSERRYEAYELRMSWGKDELDPSDPADVERGGELAYEAAKRLWPNSPCVVVMHTDGRGEKFDAETGAMGQFEGGCVHAHVLVMNHDLETGNCLEENRMHHQVKAVTDELMRERGMQVLGATKGEQSTRWEERRAHCSPFEQRLGDAVKRARDAARTLDEFRDNLTAAGVELVEKVKRDEDGVEHVGWTYKMVDTDAPRPRKRRRKAKNLADELDKKAVEAHFERERLQAQAQQAAPAPAPAPVPTPVEMPEERPETPEKATQTDMAPTTPEEPEKPAERVWEAPTEVPRVRVEDSKQWRAFTEFELSEDDVEHARKAARDEAVRRAKRHGRPIKGNPQVERFRAMGREELAEEVERLNERVDEARERFRASKEHAADMRAMRAGGGSGNLAAYKALSVVIAMAWGDMGAGGRKREQTPFEQFMEMMMQMQLRAMMQAERMAQRDAAKRRREEADRRLYEARAAMWDAEKLAKDAGRVLDEMDAGNNRRVRDAEQMASRNVSYRFNEGSQFER